MALVPVDSGSPRREKQTPRAAAVDNRGVIDYPVDFSFVNMTHCSEFCHEKPRSYEDEFCHEKPRSYPDREPLQDEDGKYTSHCLRLCHNVLQNLSALPESVSKVFANPMEISWIDLSFNELTTIDQCLCDCQNLHILYLHGNQIANIDEADKLGGLPLLYKLTLHGNPIETTKGYRCHILSRIPQLLSLDFSTVTKGDRATTATIKSFAPQKRKKRQAQD